MNKLAVHQITSHLTSPVLEQHLGVGPHAIRYSRTTGIFPGSWYGTVKTLCDAAGIECPLNAFSWKVGQHQEHVDADPALTGVESPTSPKQEHRHGVIPTAR